MTPVPKTPDPTPTQIRGLRMMAEAYEADLPVKVGTKTFKLASDKGAYYEISGTIARRLVDHGFACWSRPVGRFLLLTNAGFAVAGVRASAA